MIFAFILFYSYSIIVCRLIKNKWKSISEPDVVSDCKSCEDSFEIAYDGKTYLEDGQLRFAPCVYVQRYIAVKDKLEQLGPFKKVVDLGCSELGFFSYLKHLEGVEEILLVDQDESLLRQRCGVLQPLLIDHLKRRNTPLSVKLLCGNAAFPDSNLADTSAVVAIELIEHMFPPDLNDLPFTLFGIIKPQVVIVTTPNYDFNCLFKLTGFRHFDHKFEWTRQQFKDWVDNIVLRFPQYSSKLYGIGPGPADAAQHGACSQMVVFQINPSIPKPPSPIFTWEKSYQIISEINYPYEPKVELTLEEQVKYEANRFIRYAVSYDDYCGDERIEIPLSSIMRMVTRHTNSQELLQSVLEESGWTVEQNESGEKCVVLPLSGIPCSSSSSQSGEVADQSFVPHSDLFTNNWEVDDLESENWSSDHDDTVDRRPGFEEYPHVNPKSCSQTAPCSTRQLDDLYKGCDPNECKIYDSCLSDRINNSCKSSFKLIEDSSDFNRKTGETSSEQPGSDEKKYTSSHDIDTLVKCKSKEERHCVLEYSPKSVYYAKEKLQADSYARSFSEQGLETDTGFSNKEIKDGDGEVCSARLYSLGKQSKTGKESFDSFEDCRGGGNSLPKIDMCSVKRSLDLPLCPMKAKYNGNYEGINPLCKRYNDIKPPPFDGISENKNYQGNMKLTKSGGNVSGPLDFNLLSLGKLSDLGPSSSGGGEAPKIILEQKDSKVSDTIRDRGKIDSLPNQSGINRCLSLQHIKEKEGVIKSNRFSLCCEKENINISDIFKDGLKTKSCGHSFDEVIDLIRVDVTANFDDSCSQSKAVDSGYPNTSDRDMDMDLTPEQVDELLSENESSLDEREEEEERGLGGAAAPVQILDHVENGDVANNNRDDEGNNLDQVDLGHPLHFNQIIVEEGNDAALDEVPPPPHHQDSDSENEEKFMSCASLVNDSVSNDSGESERMKTCLGWLQTSTPCPSRGLVWRSPDVSLLERRDFASSSTSLEVHPPSSSLSIGTLEPFPSWLLEIEVEDAGDSHNNFPGDFPEAQEVSSSLTLHEEERTEVVREDILGGGEPHQEL